MEIKKRRKHKPAKCTVTSETVSPPEKKKKVISESPDSQAEGPFYITDTLSVSEDSPHAPNSDLCHLHYLSLQMFTSGVT